jgi:hypothetical protein
MHRLLVKSAARTAFGVAAICIGVPLLQGPDLYLSQGAEPPATLVVEARPSTLVPHQPGRLVLVVHNTATTPAVVNRITTSVREQVPGCTLSAAAWTGNLVVSPGSWVERTVPATLTGPRCAQRTWTLDFTAATA